MRDGYEISANLDVVLQKLEFWHYGKMTTADVEELTAAMHELIAEAEEREAWLWDNLPEDDGARNYEHAAELAELTEYLRSIAK